MKFSASANITTAITTGHVLHFIDYNIIKHAYHVTLAELVLIPIALLSLVLCFLVLLLSTLYRQTGTGNLLLALIFAECVVLVADVFFAVDLVGFYLDLGFVFLNGSEILCRATYLLGYMGQLSYAWFTVAVVGERTFTRTVLLVRQRQFRMKPRFVWIIIVVVNVIAMVLGSFPLWTITPRHRDRCYDYIANNSMYRTWYHVVMRTGYYILPTFLVTSLTVWLLVVEVLLRKQRKLTQQSADDSFAVCLQQQLSYISILVSVLFLPIHLTNTVLGNIVPESYRQTLLLFLDVSLVTAVMAAATAIRLILFCVISQIFRQEAKHQLGCGRSNNTADAEQYVELQE